VSEVNSARRWAIEVLLLVYQDGGEAAAARRPLAHAVGAPGVAQRTDATSNTTTAEGSCEATRSALVSGRLVEARTTLALDV
jgi:hypothetical protein